MGAPPWIREHRGVTSGSTTIFIYKIYNIKSLENYFNLNKQKYKKTSGNSLINTQENRTHLRPYLPTDRCSPRKEPTLTGRL